ncbi:MAG: ribosome small subunit-dependent GTPase A [Ruminococcaceae bacterium]|nr:ribosome small subunit-dependent GTPase A [Oscillospiraceae bacterium]
METALKAKILKGVGGLYSVRVIEPNTPLTGEILRCRARGAFRHNNLSPLPGDFVTVSADGEGEEASCVISEIVQRRNSLIRPPMANLDYLFVTMAAASPSPILSTIDKLIAIAEHNKIEPVVVITKCELDSARAKEIYEIYSKCGFYCFMLSAKENIGVSDIDEFIREKLPTKTAAFAGASGIGKSTLLNRLFPSLDLSTAEISKKIERGRHTTREVNLFPLSEEIDCGYIADTPGFSMLDFKRFDFFEKDDLIDTMREFAPYIGSCRYTKCSHTKEQGCAVIEAIRSGYISKSRHDSYVEIYDILKTRKKWD